MHCKVQNILVNQISVGQLYLARYTQNFGMKFRKMSVPFAPLPGISGIFGRMESAPDIRRNVSHKFTEPSMDDKLARSF